MGVRGIGATKEQAFEQAALAMTAVITDPAKAAPLEPVEIQCEAPDDELLFVDWLNALVYEMATRKLLFGRFEVHINGARWVDWTWGEVAHVVGRWRAAFKKEGLKPGDRVALCLRNRTEWVVFDQAALELGLVSVPLYFDDRPDNMAWCLNDAGVRPLPVGGGQTHGARARRAGRSRDHRLYLGHHGAAQGRDALAP